MSLWANIAGAWRTGVLWQNVGGTWKRGILAGNVAGVWKKDSSPTPGGGGGSLAASTSPTSVYGSVSRSSRATVSTNTTTVTPAGGTSPYTYRWAPVTGWNVADPLREVTRFTSDVDPREEKDAVFVCTVTDARGSTTTVSVVAGVANYYSGGGGAQIQ